MAQTMIQQIAEYSTAVDTGSITAEAKHETKRLILDSIGCALAATEDPKGRIGIEYGTQLGAGREEATVFGTDKRLSILGAAFANGELINSLDFDAILPPGHVSPYVIPAALAEAEHRGTSGAEVLVSLAIAHDLSYRLGKAMDYLRDIKDGKVSNPRVYGYSSTIFGAVAALMRVRGAGAELTAHALGIAGCTVPVNSHMAWVRHAPSTTIKYTVAGSMVQTALTAAGLAELGHRGDVQLLDDPEFGFPAMIGTTRWEPERITRNLGSEWAFVNESSIKPYPHCRVLHNVFDVLTAVLERDDIRPEEITAIRVFGEAFVDQPIWQNQEIGHLQDGQFSINHGIAVAAHRVRPGKEWQTPEMVHSESVMALMKKVTHKPHPEYVKLLSDHPSSRQARVEVDARGTTFSDEKRFPKGSPSSDPESYMTDEQLVAKFLHNATGVMRPDAADEVVAMIMGLEDVADFATIATLMRKSRA